MKSLKFLFLSVCLFSSCCSEEKIVYRTQEEVEQILENEALIEMQHYLPKEAELVEILPSASTKGKWIIVKIRNNYFLHRFNHDYYTSTEVMIPFNYTKK